MRRAIFFLLLLLSLSLVVNAQLQPLAPPQPPAGPCVDPNDPFGPGPHVIGQLPDGPVSPAGPPPPPCPPSPGPPAPNLPVPLPPPPQGPNNCDDPNRHNDPFGPGPHIGGAPTSPVPPMGPPCPEDSSVGSVIDIELLIPPQYRVGSVPYVWLKTDVSANVYVIDVDPQRQVFRMPGSSMTFADSWQLFAEGTWLNNPTGIDSINVVAVTSPLSVQFETMILDPQNYVWDGQAYRLSESVRQQLAGIGASYLYRTYQIID